MHTILGANGVVGRELALELGRLGVPVRQVSRNPRRVNGGDETVAADLTDGAATERAVRGSSVAYLVAGLRYDTRVWREEWPRVMGNAIGACARHRCRLVFLDNVYAYGRVEGEMTEETPFSPNSRKGEVRARIATTLLDAIRAGEVEAMIVRSADFYGPGAVQSVTQATVFSRLREGKTPQWIGSVDAVHTFTYTPDLGRALAFLGTREDGWGTTWHAPTSPEAITGRDFARMACMAAGTSPGVQAVPGWVLRLMGLWMPVLRENREMMYQFEHDYRFSSRKIARAHGLEATRYEAGIPASLASA